MKDMGRETTGFQPAGIEISNLQAPAPPIPRPGRRGVPSPDIQPRRRRAIGLTELVVGAGAVATAGAAVAVGVSFLRQQGQNPDQTPLPGGIVEPSNSPIPTPFSTENPTFTLPPKSPSPPPEATPPPAEPTLKPTENLSALEKTLKSWVDGTYKMPELFTQSWDGKPAPLNITFTDTKKFENFNLNEQSFGYQGVLLAEQVIDDHLIIYVGQQDSKGNNYYFPMNVGNLKDFVKHPIAEAPYYSDGNSRNSIFYHAAETQEIMDKNLGTSIMFGIVSQPIPASTTIPPGIGLDEIKSQVPFSQDFLRFSVSAVSKSSYQNASHASEFKNLINHVVTKVDPERLPFANLLELRNIN